MVVRDPCCIRPGDDLAPATVLDLQASSAAKWYDEFKRGYLDTEAQCLAQGVEFLPLVAESSSGWGVSALKCFRKVVKMTEDSGAVDAETSLGWLLQGLSVTMRSIAARAVLKRATLSAPHPPAGQVVAEGILAASPD